MAKRSTKRFPPADVQPLHADRPAATAPDPAGAQPASNTVQLACLLLLAAGACAAWAVGAAPWQRPVVASLLGAVVVLSLVPFTAVRLSAWIDRVRVPSRRTAHAIAVLIAAVAFAYLYWTARWQGRGLVPTWHDEQMYLLQARLLAHGRLWTAPHPLADFFETFYVFTRPVYAPNYFPGTALLNVPAIWLRLPYWVLPAIIASTCVGLLYRIVTALLDGVAGLLAAIMLLGVGEFRLLSMMTMSHTALMLLALACVASYLAWRRRRTVAWAVVVGALAGWAAITRPIDAACWVLPIGVAMLLDLRGAPRRRWLVTLLAGCGAAVPFLALQGVMNVGITGSLFKTPATLYAEREWPGLTFLGFPGFDESRRPPSELPQKQEIYREMLAPALRSHTRGNVAASWLGPRLLITVNGTLPDPLLAAFVPLALLAVWRERRWVLWAPFPLFVIAYSFNPFLLAHYPLVVAPAVLFSVLAGFEALRRTFPAARAQLATLLTLGPLFIALAALPQLNANARDIKYEFPLMRYVYKELPSRVQTPAIVLFTYAPGGAHQEPVYNIDVVNPDDAPIIKAHDLGPRRDMDLIRYYAQRQPARHVYLYDRETDQLHELGTAGVLAKRGVPPAPHR